MMPAAIHLSIGSLPLIMRSHMNVSLSSFKNDPEFVNKIGVALGASSFAVVGRWRSSRLQNLSGNVLSRKRFRQINRELDDADGKVNQALVGSGLRTFLLKTGLAQFHRVIRPPC